MLRVALAFMTLCIVAAIANTVWAVETGGETALFHKSLKLPSGQLLVVEENSLEPRSVGSYSVRLYSGANPELPYDEFVVGIVRARDGVIEDVSLVPEIQCTQCVMVKMRSAGSGGSLAADFISYGPTEVVWRVGLRGMPPDTELPGSEFLLSF